MIQKSIAGRAQSPSQLMTYTAYAVDNARLLEEAQEAARKLNEIVEDQKLRLKVAQQQMLQAAKISALGELVAGVSHKRPEITSTAPLSALYVGAGHEQPAGAAALMHR